MARRLRDNAVSTADARVQLSSDAADRENDPYIGSTDVGMIGLQDDDDSAWLLRKFNPNEWLKFKFQDQVAAEIDVGATGAGPIQLPLVEYIYLTNVTKVQSYLLPGFSVTVPDGFRLWVIVPEVVGANTQSIRSNIGQAILNPDSTPPDLMDITSDFGNVLFKWVAASSSWVWLSRI